MAVLVLSMSVRKGHGLEARLDKGMTALDQVQAAKQKSQRSAAKPQWLSTLFSPTTIG